MRKRDRISKQRVFNRVCEFMMSNNNVYRGGYVDPNDLTKTCAIGALTSMKARKDENLLSKEIGEIESACGFDFLAGITWINDNVKPSRRAQALRSFAKKNDLKIHPIISL